ncbi:MAG: hypothetical protein ABR538_11905 [Candidatus Binatia bacterium]
MSPLLVGVLACTAVALWLVWPAFAPGRIVNLDAPRHLLRSMVMADQLLPSGHVDGWSPWWYLGAQLFLFQSYGYFFLIGASAWLVAGVVGLGTVFKFWYVLPIVALPAATAWAAVRLGVSRRGSAVAALASLIFSSSLGYGVGGVFGIGLLLQGAGVLGFALVWPQILAVLLDRKNSVWPVALATGALLLVHFITGAYVLAAAGLVATGVALAGRDPRPLLRYLLLATLVLLLAGHSLFPSLEWRDLAGPGVGWGSDRGRFDKFLLGTLFGAQPLAIAALAAAAWSLRSGNRPLAISAAVLFATGAVGGANEQGWEPDWLARILDTLVRPRALPYAALLQAVFVGVAADLVLEKAAAASRKYGRPILAAAAPFAIAASLLWVAPAELADQRTSVRTESALKARDRRIYLDLVRWLRANVPPPAVLAVPRTLFPNDVVGARSVISLLNLDTGLFTLSGDQAELTRSARKAGRLNLDRLHEAGAKGLTVLRGAGVSHVILSNPAARRALVRNRQYELVYEDQPGRARPAGRRRGDEPREAVGVAVYRLRGGGVRLHGPGLKVLGTTFEPERLTWSVLVGPVPRPRSSVAAVNWHPNWTARVDGVRVATKCSPSRRVAFRVPEGTRTVALEFERSAREKGYNALSAATLLLVVAAWRRDARRRRRDQRRSGDDNEAGRPVGTPVG